MKKQYILNGSVHFGFLKQTFGSGTIFDVDTEVGKFVHAGKEYSDLRDIEIGIRAGFLKELTAKSQEQVKNTNDRQDRAFNKIVGNKVKESNPTLPIVRSEIDERGEIDIAWTKTKVTSDVEKEKNPDLKVVRSEEENKSLGMSVMRLNDAPVESEEEVIVTGEYGMPNKVAGVEEMMTIGMNGEKIDINKVEPLNAKVKGKPGRKPGQKNKVVGELDKTKALAEQKRLDRMKEIEENRNASQVDAERAAKKVDPKFTELADEARQLGAEVVQSAVSQVKLDAK